MNYYTHPDYIGRIIQTRDPNSSEQWEIEAMLADAAELRRVARRAQRAARRRNPRSPMMRLVSKLPI